MKPAHEPALDGLRAVAALAVLFFHAKVPYFRGGTAGVDVFFVLSGYLVTAILATNPPSYAHFTERRLRRLMPAFATMVGVTLPILLLAFPQQGLAISRDAILALAYSLNWVPLVAHWWESPYMPAWTLAVEMQFYLVWPLLLPMVLRLRWPAGALVVVWGLVTLARTLHDASFELRYFGLHFGGLFLGAALALLPPFPRWSGPIGAVLIALAVCISGDTTTAELGSALVIGSLAGPSSLKTWLSWRPLAGIGLISYGVYLWHSPILFLMKGAPWWVAAPTATISSLCIATASYLAVEKRFRRSAKADLSLLAVRGSA